MQAILRTNEASIGACLVREREVYVRGANSDSRQHYESSPPLAVISVHPEVIVSRDGLRQGYGAKRQCFECSRTRARARVQGTCLLTGEH